MDSPNSVVTTADHVRYSCQIEPPVEVPAPREELPPPPPQKPPCCPVLPDPASSLVDALPTILVGIGVAYAIGMLTGAFIFSPVVE